MFTDLSNNIGIIKKISHDFSLQSKDPSLSFEDFVSEGILVYANCIANYNPGESKFSTYLYKSLRNEFIKIIDKSNRSAHTVDKKGVLRCVDQHTSYDISPERHAMLIEAMIALSEVSEDFVAMVTEGIPHDMKKLIIREMRVKRSRRGLPTADGKLFLRKGLVETFFSVNIEKLREIFYNYI